jgi:uncharacterized protein YdhG (YjbR/CyaY superfamily)
LLIKDGDMSAREIDAYLETLDEPQRGALSEIRDAIMAVVPDAEQCISYTYPAFRLGGKVVAGFGAFKQHNSYFPHSGSVLSALQDELTGYSMTKGALHFSSNTPLPRALVTRLLETRIQQISHAAK